MNKEFLLTVFIVSILTLASGDTGRKFELINAGVPGNRTTNLLRRLQDDVLSHQPGVVVIMAGTNDRLNSGGFVSAANYRKNMESLVSQIRDGGAEVILVTPPPCIPELLYTRHDRAKFSDLSPAERMKEVREILVDIAKSTNVPLVDFHDYLVTEHLTGNNKESVLRNPSNGGGNDGVHLIPRGYEILAKLVAAEIRALKFESSKVICFGDSLTHGPNRDEVKTVTGKNYPAYLKALLSGEGIIQ